MYPIFRFIFILKNSLKYPWIYHLPKNFTTEYLLRKTCWLKTTLISFNYDNNTSREEQILLLIFGLWCLIFMFSFLLQRNIEEFFRMEMKLKTMVFNYSKNNLKRAEHRWKSRKTSCTCCDSLLPYLIIFIVSSKFAFLQLGKKKVSYHVVTSTNFYPSISLFIITSFDQFSCSI